MSLTSTLNVNQISNARDTYVNECAFCDVVIFFIRVSKCMIRAIFTPSEVLIEMNVTIAFLFMYQYLIYICSVLIRLVFCLAINLSLDLFSVCNFRY